MYDNIPKNTDMRILHIDLMCNAGPYWSRQLASMSSLYMFVSANNPQQLQHALRCKPTHIIYGGGFWNSYLFNNNFDLIINYLKCSPRCVTWGYWGDGTISLIKNPSKYVFADIVFCSSTDAVQAFKEIGFNAEFAVHPVDNNTYYRHPLIGERYDWCFVGTNYGKTRTRHLEAAKEISGNGLVRGLGHNPAVTFSTFEETANLFRQSRIILNINDDDYIHLGMYFSDRLLMAMFLCKFLLTTYQPGLEKIFKRGVHLDWYKDEKELKEKLKYYLDNPKERNNIAIAGSKLMKTYSIEHMIPSFFQKAITQHRWKK